METTKPYRLFVGFVVCCGPVLVAISLVVADRTGNNGGSLAGTGDFPLSAVSCLLSAVRIY